MVNLSLLQILAISSFLLVPVWTSHSAIADETGENSMIDIWIGTSASPLSEGIYHCKFNTKTGQLSKAELAAEVDGPGFLAMHPNGNVLYAVGSLDGKASVIAFQVKDAAGNVQLELLNSLPIGDGGAAHVSVDSQGKMLLTAQYGGGSVAVFSLAPDGSIEGRTQLIKHQGGSKVVENRQDRSHAHWGGFSPDERFAFVPDLGLDQVVIYRVNSDEASLSANGFGEAPKGGGPRHMAFHPNGHWIYVVNELALTMTVFDYDAPSGAMTPKQTIEAVPKKIMERELFNSGSEVCVHPNGRFLYSANRGHDTISVYKIDQASGRLEVVQIEPIRGATPRNFNIDPTGKWLLVAGQDSNTLASFVMEAETGKLTYNRSIIFVPTPICVLPVGKNRD
ncbi:6-phosphogluconolactonase [Novipirellula aureliae]|uniref:6-phosphogluconolactonase n=1 Tax=Novipirellula aureliae TaxID=2527966 RepID=A0A5C6DV90_9BACT|nr:lactonase family protein [Novipirellula aureliae]TWU38996.1 6-phosphogluconolactonase [Novipirellula aureliae]